MRRLEVTIAGWWYLALTISLGVVAIVSGNNALYLIESLLLSAMIFSGLLSERFVSALDLDVARCQASAGSPARDRIGVRNRGAFPLFCVEIGEWRSGGFIPAAYIPRIGPRERLALRARYILEARGLHQWEGLAIATAYPFGLARKIRWIKEPGSRVVWPARADSSGAADTEGGQSRRPRPGSEFSEGEVRPLTPDDDGRAVVWTLSARGGDPYTRVRKADAEEPTVILDLRVDPGSEFERSVAAAAAPFYRQTDGSCSGTLILIDAQGRRRVRGRASALTQLGLARASGKAEA